MSRSPGESTKAVRRLIGAVESVAGVERTVSTDQANLSIAVDERYLVKWFAQAVDDADLAVLQHLAAARFEHMPRLVGVLDEGGHVVATVSEFVVGATDGWQWYVDDVLAWLDGNKPLDDLVLTAARMGSITAQLHTALADATPQHGSLDLLRAQIDDRRRIAITETTGVDGERLQARLGQIDAALHVLATFTHVPVQRVHGDLHAGQFLRAGDRLLLTDFDGDPMTDSADRMQRQPIERDLAALLQSIDHVGRVAARRRDDARVESFVVAGIAAATDGYRATRTFHPQLLFALRVAQELHEYAYAATRLPVWGYVPDAATIALFPDEDDDR